MVDGQFDIVELIGDIFKDIGDNLRPLEARKIENWWKIDFFCRNLSQNSSPFDI